MLEVTTQLREHLDRQLKKQGCFSRLAIEEELRRFYSIEDEDEDAFDELHDAISELHADYMQRGLAKEDD